MPATPPVPPSMLGWSIEPGSLIIDESIASITFIVERFYTTDSVETVYISTRSDQGFGNESDYDDITALPITFEIGEESKQITVNLVNDDAIESVETFGLSLYSDVGENSADLLAQALFSIVDDELPFQPKVFTANDDLVAVSPIGTSTILDGLTGNDTVVLDLSSWVNGVNTTSDGIDWVFSSGPDSIRFRNVENFVVFGSDNNDTLTAWPGGSHLFGGAGNDLLIGGADVDLLDGGSGDDTIIGVRFGDIVAGGNGIDSVTFNVASIAEPVKVDLAAGIGLGATWTGVEFAGGVLGQSNDEFSAFVQVDSVDGGSGIDLFAADYSIDSPDGRVPSGIHFGSLETTADEVVTFTNGSEARFDVDNFERFHIVGTGGDDTIDVSSSTEGNILRGGAGDDIFYAGTAADHLFGDDDNDTFHAVGFGDMVSGGHGTDTAFFDYSGYPDDLTLDLITGTAPGSFWESVEFASGLLGQGNDNFVAGIQLHSVDALGGTDSLSLDYSAALEDGRSVQRIDFSSLSNSGTEKVILNDGNEYLLSINGFEQHQIEASPGDDVIDLTATTGKHSLSGNIGNDLLIGGQNNDILSGGPGDDTLHGQGGSDNLSGGDDNDKFVNVDFEDTVDGGDGFDSVTFNFSGAEGAVSINLIDGMTTGVHWSNIEAASGTMGQGNDQFSAFLQFSSINGSGGTDAITLDYSTALPDGRTVKQLDFGSLSSTEDEVVVLSDDAILSFDIDGFESYHIIGSSGDDFIDLQSGTAGNKVFGRDGNDLLTASAGPDFLDGGDDDDLFLGVGRGDTVEGGLGVDTLSFSMSNETADLTIDLLTGSAPDGTWTGVEFAGGTLGQGNDQFITTTQLNSVNANGGIDRLTLDYSKMLADGRTATQVNFSDLANGSDEVVTLSDAKQYRFDIIGFEAFNITGTPGNDIIDGTSGIAGNILHGKSGMDMLFDGPGDDVISGGHGTDTLYLTSGQDTVSGNLAELDGDRVHGLVVGENIVIKDTFITSSRLITNDTGQLLMIDDNADSVADSTILLFDSPPITSFQLTYNGNDSILTASTNQPVAGASIHGRFFRDANENALDDSEPGVPGQPVTLIRGGLGIVAQTSTDPDGGFSFIGLGEAEYRVRFDAPSDGSAFAIPNVGSDDTIDSDVTSVDVRARGLTEKVYLETGEAISDIDAGIGPAGPASISGRLFLDDNLNSIFDDDPVIEGHVVTLIQTGIGIVDQTLTGSDGSYRFDTLDEGRYRVRFDADPSETAFVEPNAGLDDTIDSDVTEIDLVGRGLTDKFDLQPGQILENVDAGVEALNLATISGRFFDDRNRDNLDTSEPGIGGVTVTLLKSGPGIIAQTSTSPDGSYFFTDLENGDYRIRFDPAPGGKEFVLPNIGSDDTVDSDVTLIDQLGRGLTEKFALSMGTNIEDLDAGASSNAPTTVSGKYFYDQNGNAIDDLEPGIAGVKVTLFKTGIGAVAQTTTAQDGSYEFSILDEGRFRVRFDPDPSGGTFVDANVGSDTTIDSDVTELDFLFRGLTEKFDVAFGGEANNIDAGVHSASPAISQTTGLYGNPYSDLANEDMFTVDHSTLVDFLT